MPKSHRDYQGIIKSHKKRIKLKNRGARCSGGAHTVYGGKGVTEAMLRPVVIVCKRLRLYRPSGVCDGETPPPHHHGRLHTTTARRHRHTTAASTLRRWDADGTSRRRYILPCLNLADSMAEINRRPMAVNPSQPNNNVGTCNSAKNDNMTRRMSDGTAPDMKSSIFSAIYCR